MKEGVEHKIKDYAQAINKYNNISFYVNFELVVSFFVVFFQVGTLTYLLSSYVFSGYVPLVFSCVLSYIAADFFNGIAHMIIDNNTSYHSVFGPFIAAFHMHHVRLKYKENNAFKIYFYESGHKIWLVIYLSLLFLIQLNFYLNSHVMLFFVMFGILSSMAEVSHFWCHNHAHKTKGLIVFLQKKHVLLSLKHHRLHHINDNVNYAFLNGMSDPLLNYIAKTYYCGYKQNSDLHVAAYIKNKDLLCR